MKKIISLFQRNYDTDRLVRNEVVPGAEWVIAGEGIATVKFDGTCCLVKDHKLFRRYDVKHGKETPVGFIPAQDPDPVTGYWPGWIAVGDGPEDKYHREAYYFMGNIGCSLPDGTYELCGPKIQGNPESLEQHQLIKHGESILKTEEVPREFNALREWLATQNIEGIVWHRGNGDMVKIKKKDFGLKRKNETS